MDPTIHLRTDTHNEVLMDAGYLLWEARHWDSWSTVKGAENNIISLLHYVSKAENTYWRWIRVWRALNQVGIQMRRYEGDPAVMKVLRVAHNGLVMDYNKYHWAQWKERYPKVINVKRGQPPLSPFKKWDWDDAFEKLRRLAETKPDSFALLLRHMESQTGKRTQTRPWLRFLRKARDIGFDYADQVRRDTTPPSAGEVAS